MFSGLDYEKAKALAKQLYSEIKVVYCPLLEDYVYFTSHGFNHLMRKGMKVRSIKEQIKRFELVPFLAEIVGDPKADIHLDASNSVKIWNIIRKIVGEYIRVIIADTGSRKVFVSVYPPLPKTKNPTQR